LSQSALSSSYPPAPDEKEQGWEPPSPPRPKLRGLRGFYPLSRIIRGPVVCVTIMENLFSFEALLGPDFPTGLTEHWPDCPWCRGPLLLRVRRAFFRSIGVPDILLNSVFSDLRRQNEVSLTTSSPFSPTSPPHGDVFFFFTYRADCHPWDRPNSYKPI